MASGVKMFMLGVLWLANFVVLTMFTLTGGITFKTLTYLQSVVPISSNINYDIVQPIFPAFFFFLLCTLIAVSYKIYQLLASDNMYYQEA
jgi:hypothetical protein